MRTSHHTALRIGLASILAALLSHTRADPDLWGHVLFGRDIVTTGTIPQRDSFSFMSDINWINHEWLSECVMYLAYAGGGGAGLVLLKMLLLGLMVGAVIVTLRSRCISGQPLDLLVVLAVVGTFAQANHMRPQVFSLAAFAWLLVWLTGGVHRSAYRFLAIPALMVCWVNLHGGWIVGAGTLALWTMSTIASSASRTEKILLVVTSALAGAATLVNPYGWGMLSFLRETVGFGREDITDWQPVYQLGTAYVLMWCVLAGCAAAAIRTQRASGPEAIRSAALVTALAIGSFRVNRLLAFFALAVVILLGPQIAALLTRVRRTAAGRGLTPSAAAAMVALAVALASIGGGVAIAARNTECVRMDSPDLPEPEVTAIVERMQLQGRLLVWFDWGEYAIWHLGSALSVSIDGRRETVYSEDVLRRHLLFYFVPSTRAAFLEDVQPDYIWLPRNLPVVDSVIADGWMPLFSGPRSVLLGRVEQTVAPAPAAAAARCFPGP